MSAQFVVKPLSRFPVVSKPGTQHTAVHSGSSTRISQLGAHMQMPIKRGVARRAQPLGVMARTHFVIRMSLPFNFSRAMCDICL